MCLEIKEILKSRLVAATTDGWTENHTKSKLIAVTIHFISDKWKIQFRLLLAVPLPFEEGPTTAEKLRAALDAALQKFELDATKLSWVTDNGSDIVKALNGTSRFYCANHAINIIVRTTLSVKYAELIQRCIKSSALAQLIVDDCTAWVIEVRQKIPSKFASANDLTLALTNPQSQSHIKMLRSVRDAFPRVKDYLKNDCPELMVTTEDITDLIRFLGPFDLDGSREKSASVTPSRIPALLHHCALDPDDSGMMISLKDTARDECTILRALEAIEGCKQVVGYFNKSGLKPWLKQEGCRTTKQEICTRWNSQLEMLESVNDAWDKIKGLLTSKGKKGNEVLKAFNEIDKTDVEDLISFLEPFEIHTKELEGHLHPTIQKCVPSKYALLLHCEPDDDDTALMSAIRKKALDLVEDKMQIQAEQKLAYFLWPSMNGLDALPEEERNQVHADMRRRALGEDDLRDLDENQDVPQPPPAKKARVDPYAALRTKKKPVAVKDEVTKYLAMDPEEIGDDSDLLKWWQTKIFCTKLFWFAALTRMC
ncbi:uncharacterized protein LOC113215437 isoform X2 [Frankliniella occidentalis]|uniref:Uncharacterized protein LOC113215437 isoform X2 n=1 Tax=Frankliniella occidentalis TaxID=133901 RepID=A0A9C6U192_FRAOC|nr:uncharacterized protein LOC113215437 isoform X2 [Frankliniella occidentalis]